MLRNLNLFLDYLSFLKFDYSVSRVTPLHFPQTSVVYGLYYHCLSNVGLHFLLLNNRCFVDAVPSLLQRCEFLDK